MSTRLIGQNGISAFQRGQWTDDMQGMGQCAESLSPAFQHLASCCNEALVDVANGLLLFRDQSPDTAGQA